MTICTSIINDNHNEEKSFCKRLLRPATFRSCGVFQQASQYGDLYVGIGSDATYLEYKHRKPMFP